MPLFRRQDEAARHPALTINGGPQPNPEVNGGPPRRHRLFIECARRLAGDPQAASDALGRPLADGHGLESVVAKIAGLFEYERSLIRWVALRGAFTELFIRVFDSESAELSPTDLEKAMGLAWLPDASGEVRADIAEPWRSVLSPTVRDAAIGVAASTLVRVEDYGRYSEMSVPQVIADRRYWMPEAVALDCIAWSAIALLRLGVAQQVFDVVAEPDALAEPGWYPEPLFQKAERYWNGADWTAACRVWDGRRTVETSVPLG